MNRLKANIVASIAGQAWFVVVSILCTPFLIKFLGVEAYGLIAFYFLLQNLMQILDLGMGPTLNREIARVWNLDRQDRDRVDLARFVVTMERWYWVLGSAIGLALLVLAPSLVEVWLRPEQLSVDEMSQSARLMAVLACVQWTLTFYQNGLLGMQRQVALNAFQVVFGSLNVIGGVVFVWLGPRSVSGLLTWQCIITLIQSLALAKYFWNHIGLPREGLGVDFGMLRGKWGFSLGMSGISITGMVLTHLDKMILSRLLTLEAFGHYTLAGTMARGLYVLTTPLFNAYYPRFSAIVSAGEKRAILQSYHTAAQLMAALILPLALIIALFPEKLAFLWLRNLELATEISPIISLLVIGGCLNGLMVVPFALQLAHGMTKIGLYINICLVVMLVPSTIFSVLHFGALGGAAMWAVANGLYLLVGVPLTHRYLLVGEARNWLKSDLLPPFLTTMVIVGLARMLVPQCQDAISSSTYLILLWLLATFFAAMSAQRIRNWGKQVVGNLYR